MLQGPLWASGLADGVSHSIPTNRSSVKFKLAERAAGAGDLLVLVIYTGYQLLQCYSDALPCSVFRRDSVTAFAIAWNCMQSARGAALPVRRCSCFFAKLMRGNAIFGFDKACDFLKVESVIVVQIVICLRVI